MKIQSVQIRNFKGIQRESISIKGHNVYVTGRNAMGKTSFIDAIFKILSGKDLPSKPTTEGQRSGEIKIELDDLIVIAKYNEKNEKIALEITNKEGRAYTSPRTTLNEIVGAVDFNIDDFFRLTPAKQIELIKSFTGIDFTDLDEEYKKIFNERTFTNKRIKELEVLQNPFDKNKLEPTDLSIMAKDINAKRDHNQEIKDVGERSFQRGQDIKRLESEKEELLEKIKKIESQQTELNDLNDQAMKWFTTEEGKSFDITAEEEAFQTAIEDNKTIEDNIKNKELYDQFIEWMEKEQDQTKRLDEIKLSKLKAIEEAEMPASGLSFNDDGLTYHGLPFEAAQINKAQQIIIGLQMQLALLGEVKIARFDGSLIDDENLNYIEDWANKKGLQLFVELVDRSATELKIEVREEI